MNVADYETQPAFRIDASGPGLSSPSAVGLSHSPLPAFQSPLTPNRRVKEPALGPTAPNELIVFVLRNARNGFPSWSSG